MKHISEVRYFITDVVAVPVTQLFKKSDAYKRATKPGWGIVDTDKDGTLFCDEDSSAILTNMYGEQNMIFPYDELNRKEWFSQAECKVIIMTDSCGITFWTSKPKDIQIFVTYDDNGLIDTYRVTDWTDKAYDGEILINFEELPITENGK
jgi:hypothetical protein